MNKKNILRIVLILTVFPLDYFHTVFWLYALFPITWIIATCFNIGAIIFVLPKEIKNIELSREENQEISA